MEGRLLFESFNIAVAEELLLGYPHAVDELGGELGCIFNSLGVVGILAADSHCGNGHEHVVEPYGVVQRTLAHEHTVGQARAVVLEDVVIAFDHLRELQGRVGHLSSHCSCAHGAGIVEVGGGDHLTHLAVGLAFFFKGEEAGVASLRSLKRVVT